MLAEVGGWSEERHHLTSDLVVMLCPVGPGLVYSLNDLVVLAVSRQTRARIQP